jgi:hypothetical protein
LIGEPIHGAKRRNRVVEQVFCSSPAANLVGVEDHAGNTFSISVFVVRLRALRRALSDGSKTCFYLKENAMYTNYNYLIPEERRAWRSAYEIEIAAREHEERRIQMFFDGDRKTGFLSFLKAPLQMLAALIG